MNERQQLAVKLREIVGQETDPPLWIYVTKDQIPDLLRAADLLEAGGKDAWVAGFCAAGYMMTDQSEQFRNEWDKAASGDVP
jgi:hypothetical protein